MAGKIISTIIFISVILTSCIGHEEQNAGVIGDEVTTNTGLYQGNSWSGDYLWFYDATRKRVHRMNVTDLTHEMKIDALPNDLSETDNNLFSPSGLDWVIELTYKDLRVISPSGVVTENPFTFQGVPVSVSWDPDTRLIIIYDDVKSVMMGKLNEAGEFESSGIMGAILDNTTEGSSINAGDLDDQNRLILTLQNDEIAVVDFDQTLTDELWSYTSYTPTGITDVNWIAPLKNGSNRALVSAEEGIFLIDYIAQTIIDQVDFTDSESIVYLSRNLIPHIVYRSGSDSKLAYPSGDEILTASAVNVSSFLGIGASVLDTTNNHLTVAYTDTTAYEYMTKISRFRITDGLAIADQRITYDVDQVVFGEDYAFSIYGSNLGHVVRTDLSTSDQESLSGFNEPWFRNK
jgi:hypothetical protein